MLLEPSCKRTVETHDESDEYQSMNRFWRFRRGPVIGFAMGLFLVIMAFRFTVEDASEPINFLMVIPIGLLAVELGLKGGLFGAGVASAFVVFWDAVADPELTPLGFSLRFVVFLVSGVTFGALTQSRRELEGESQRWFDQSADLNCVADVEGNFVRVNAAFGDLLGYEPNDIVGTPYISYVHPDDVEETIKLSTHLAGGQTNVGGFENRYRAANGSYRWLRWSSTTDHHRGLVYASARDITETKKLETELRELAQKDPLTGLFNRRAFEIEAERQIDFLRRYGPGGALMMFDIDDFKKIHDSLGHQAGDGALKAIAAVLQDRTRVTDICARLGGDEFVILFPGIKRYEAELLANGLIGSIRERSVIEGATTVAITSSLGVAIFTGTDVGTLETLLAEADAAMYEAKRGGGDRYVISNADPVGAG